MRRRPRLDGSIQLVEKIIGTDFLLVAMNPDRFKVGRLRPVDLACGHKVLTAKRKEVSCPRCVEMLRRSIECDTGEDYDMFRNHGGSDQMVWREDPMRQFNEPTDLSGQFISDLSDITD